MSSIRKSFKLPVLAAVMSLGAVLVASLPAMARPAWLSTDANLRSAASTSASIITALPPDTAIEVMNIATGSDGYQWFYVQRQAGGTEGWVRSDLVTFGRTGRLTYGNLIGDRGERINVRSNPSTNASIAHYGLAGDVVSIGTSEQGGDGYRWYWVTFPSNASGWVRGDLIAIWGY